MDYRIVMIGPHGERDYVEKILDGGLPCVGGDDIKYAGVFPETCAKNIVKNIRKNWLTPHVSVDMELVTPSIQPGAVMKLKRDHPAYDRATLFLCSGVEGNTIRAKSHYGQEKMGPTLLWPLNGDWFDVVGATD